MKRLSLRLGAIVACLMLVIALVNCGSTTTADNSGTPPNDPPLQSVTGAEQKLSFRLVLPSDLPTGAVLAGVGVTHNPPGIPAASSTPGRDANWAIAQYKWAKGREGPWFWVVTIKETTTGLGPIVATPNASSITLGSTAAGSATSQVTVPKVGQQASVTINGVHVTRATTTLNGLGTGGNQQGTTTDYRWQSRGVDFDLTRYGDQITESGVRKIIGSMTQ